ncbi:unnamed protein product [Choristocarpus tenellus]
MSNIPFTTTHTLADDAAHGARMLDSSHKGTAKLVEHHYLGLYKMKLTNITCTEVVRPLSERGLARVSKSIKEKGWLEQFAPSDVIQRDCLDKYPSAQRRDCACH